MIRSSFAFSMFLCLVVCQMSGSADAQNPTFTDDTLNRLTAPTLLSDNSEKDYGVGDFDQDGDDDIAVGRRTALDVDTGQALANILLMNENGILVDSTAIYAPALATPRRTRDIAVADLNGDGWLDLVVGDGPNRVPLVLLNQGVIGGTWQGFVTHSTAIPASFTVDCWSLGVGDLTNDGDSYPDIFVGTLAGNDRLLVNLGDSGGSWLGFADESSRLGSNANTFAVRSVTIFDLNLDGDMDIIEGVTGSGVLRMLANDGTGQFTSTPQNLVTGAVYNHALGDLNNDGLMDMFAVANGVDQTRLNLGAGPTEVITMSPQAAAPGTNGFGSICRVADIDGNGFDDFLVADLDQQYPEDCSRRLRFLYNSGSPPYLSAGYASAQDWTPSGTSDIAILDLDGDSDLDLLIGHCGGNTVFLQDGGAVSFQRGDVNVDGMFNIADPVALLSFLFPSGPSTLLLCDDAADCNDDGSLNIADAVAALGSLFGSPTTPLPAPTSCGTDPTDDSLECVSFSACP